MTIAKLARLLLFERERTFVFERRNTAAHLYHVGKVDIGVDHAGLGASIGKNFTPGIDDQRMSVGIALVAMVPALIRCEHVAPGFDGTRAHQGMPVRLAGGLGKGSRDRDQFSTGMRQCAVQGAKPEVITDRQTEPGERRVDDYGPITGRNRLDSR